MAKSLPFENSSTKASTFGVRHLQCFLIFCGLTVAFAMRVNLSVAIVAMTDTTDINTEDGSVEYQWTERTKSLVLSSFLWCYFLTQIPGGQLAQKFGGKMLFLQSILVTAVLTLLTPLAVQFGGWKCLCALRVIEGFSQGVMYPTTHTILSKWSPVEERGILSTFCYSGAQFGTIVILASSGILASTSFGWPSIFYTSGGFGIVWSIVWIIWGASTPSEYKTLSTVEKNLIEKSLEQQANQEGGQRTLKVPWRKIFTSVPFLVLLVVHCANDWGFWTLLTQMPTYMRSVLGMNIKNNALLSALPYLTMFVLGFVFSNASKLLHKHECISLTTSRKLFNTISQWIPMLTIVALGYVTLEHTKLAVTLLTITVGLNSAAYVGFNINHIDLSPNFAGILMGVTNCAANVISFIAPLVVGFVVKDERDPNQWRIVFFIAGGIYLVGNLLFILFGTAKVQPWNDLAITIQSPQEMKLINGENVSPED